MDKDQLLSDFNTSTQNVLRQLSGFPAEAFNRKPADDSWSAAQIAEHLLILDIVTNKVLAGETVPTNRPPDEKIKFIKAVMLDAGTKRTAPERVQPSAEAKEVQAMIGYFQKQRERMKSIINATDITEACISYKHPGFGTLTKLEWIYFIIYHTERHLGQLQRLKEAVHT